MILSLSHVCIEMSIFTVSVSLFRRWQINPRNFIHCKTTSWNFLCWNLLIEKNMRYRTAILIFDSDQNVRIPIRINITNSKPRKQITRFICVISDFFGINIISQQLIIHKFRLSFDCSICNTIFIKLFICITEHLLVRWKYRF